MSNPPSPADALLVRDHCLCLHSQRAARALARRFDAVFRPVGISSGQFSLLMGLNRPEPGSMARLGALLAMDRTTLTAALKVLERRGLVRVAPDPRDRRVRLAALTEAGRAALAQAMPLWRAAHAEEEQRLADAEALRAGLRALV